MYSFYCSQAKVGLEQLLLKYGTASLLVASKYSFTAGGLDIFPNFESFCNETMSILPGARVIEMAPLVYGVAQRVALERQTLATLGTQYNESCINASALQVGPLKSGRPLRTPLTARCGSCIPRRI